jgi:hypothetical protein
MTVSISPLGPGFISLKDAAALWAAASPLKPYDDAMGLLVRAVFSGEFDPARPDPNILWNPGAFAKAGLRPILRRPGAAIFTPMAYQV